MEYVERIIKQGDELFEKRGSLLSYWQEVADNFYPERADFTTCHNLGADMARNLTTSYPIMVRRDLGNAITSMTRPTAKEWLKMRSRRPEKESTRAKQWFEWMSKFIRNAMYDTRSGFVRATKEGDHDFASFGQCVISYEMNREFNGVLYRCWHLRDCAWMEDYTGKVDTLYRKWKPTIDTLMQLWPKTIHQDLKDKYANDKFYEEVEVYHCVMPVEQFISMGGTKLRQPFVSCYIDIQHKTIMEATGQWSLGYAVPRWSTVSGSQYAHSPAVIAALPDARLLQEITTILLEAGEKAVTPPMIAVQEAIRGDISLFAGGITYADAEYDERLGEVLRAVQMVDKAGIQLGLETMQDLRAQMADAFYLSKLNLPPVAGRDMTAYEVGQRIQEFIRNALPLFEPMETDYNGQLAEGTFDLIIHNSPEARRSIPPELSEQEFDFTFESPLHEAVEKIKASQFMEAQQIIATAVQLDPSIAYLVDGQKATRDVLSAVIPNDWIRDEGTVAELLKQQQEKQALADQLALAQQGAMVAKTLKEASPTVGVGGAGGVI